jgi:hypothetical protein
MGVWAAGLYSGDFAMDLRSTIGAVARLPFDGDQLTDILRQAEPAAADRPDDPDHTTFWLVLADQFAKRGIVCDRARTAALSIISSGSDLAMLTRLGMTPVNLKKREKMLAELHQRLLAPPESSRTRNVLKNPQAFLMDVGDILIYPTCRGKCINPYLASKDQFQPWTQDGWSAAVIIDRGRAFDFLSWYRPLTFTGGMSQAPTLEELRGEVLWKLERAGTCSLVHFKRMELQKLGTLAIDPDKMKRFFPDMRPGTSQAINDISIANALNAGPPVAGQSRPHPTILGLEKILST